MADRVQSYEGELRVLSRENEFLYNVELALLDDRLTANGWRYENLAEHMAAFAKKPILIAYTRGGTKIGDGHNMRVVRGSNGEEYASFTDAESERIIGSLSDNEEDIRLVEEDGHTWIVGKGTLWTWYAREAVEKIARQGRMSISIETLVTRNRMEDGIEVEEAYIPLGATILGDDVPPAVAGANIRPLSAEYVDEFHSLTVRAASYIGIKSADEDEPDEDEHEPEDEEPEDDREDEPDDDAGEEHDDEPDEDDDDDDESPDAGEQAPPAEHEHRSVKKNMNRKLIQETQKSFPDYRVMSVSDDGKNVFLLAKDGEPKEYIFGEEDGGAVIDAKFQSARSVMIQATMNSGNVYEVEADEYTDDMNRRIATLSADLDAERARREKAENDLNALREQEKKRRVSYALAAIKRTLAEINEAMNEAERFEAEDVKGIEDCVNAGEYTDCVNAEGEWNGDERACAAVQALCMKKVMERRSRHIRPNSWDGFMGHGGETDRAVQSFNALK